MSELNHRGDNRMETKQVSSWEELIEVLQAIHTQYSKTVNDQYEGKNLILYSGLSDSSWQLQTTLERQSNRLWTVRKYIR